jgi:hypothetical protein
VTGSRKRTKPGSSRTRVKNPIAKALSQPTLRLRVRAPKRLVPGRTETKRKLKAGDYE